MNGSGERGTVAATTPDRRAPRQQNKLSDGITLAELWRSYTPAIRHPLTQPLLLEPYGASITPERHLAVPLFTRDLAPLANLLLLLSLIHI